MPPRTISKGSGKGKTSTKGSQEGWSTGNAKKVSATKGSLKTSAKGNQKEKNGRGSSSGAGKAGRSSAKGSVIKPSHKAVKEEATADHNTSLKRKKQASEEEEETLATAKRVVDAITGMKTIQTYTWNIHSELNPILLRFMNIYIHKNTYTVGTAAVVAAISTMATTTAVAALVSASASKEEEEQRTSRIPKRQKTAATGTLVKVVKGNAIVNGKKTRKL